MPCTAVRREVEVACQEHEEVELGKAISVAAELEREEQAAAEAKAYAQAARWSFEQRRRERALKRDQEQAGLEAARDLATQYGGVDEQARMSDEFEATARRTKYTRKLEQHVAHAGDRVTECCTIIESLLAQLSEEERVRARAVVAQAAASSSSLTTSDVEAMKVPELMEALGARGLDQRGRKSQLVGRLLAHLQ